MKREDFFEKLDDFDFDSFGKDDNFDNTDAYQVVQFFANKIYDGIESRTCGNCKHDRSYTRNCEAYVGRPAYDDASWKYEQVGDFSCDLWEAKT